MSLHVLDLNYIINTKVKPCQMTEIQYIKIYETTKYNYHLIDSIPK